MTATEVLDALQPLGRDSYRNVLLKHGIPEPVFGVKIEELKKLRKRIGKDYQLALDLYDTGVYDAMYLAGLIADEARMTKKDLQRWADRASCAALSQYTVAWVAAESRYGYELALRWTGSKKELVATAGWATLSSLVGVQDDADLDLAGLEKLLRRVRETIHQQPDRVRYAMNGFVIAAGGSVRALTDLAIRMGEAVGPVSVDMGETACKVPYAPDYIRKIGQRGAIGKKRKTARC